LPDTALDGWTSRCRIWLYLIKAAPAASLARRQRRVQPFLRPARRTPGHTMHSAQINEAHTLRRPVERSAIFLGLRCPARGNPLARRPPTRDGRLADGRGVTGTGRANLVFGSPNLGTCGFQSRYRFRIRRIDQGK